MATGVSELEISRSALAILCGHAGRAYPDECCGLLTGHADASRRGFARVDRVIPAQNRAEDPRRSFEVDPAAQFALLRGLRAAAESGGGSPEQWLGHYHSHPDAPARPSPRDLAQALDDGLIWLIVATSKAGAGEVTAWRAERNDDATAAFRPVVLTTTA